MIRRSRGSRYPATTRSTGSDTDELQTDVMRFMSILGLCLMAVFALVQSIPFDEQRPLSPRPELAGLQQDIATQQQRALSLQAQLDRLSVELQDAQQRQAAARQSLSTTRQQLVLLSDQRQQARSERDRLMAELQALQQQLALGRDELAALEQASRDRSRSLRELGKRLGEARARLDDTAQRTKALQIQDAARPLAPAKEESTSLPRAAQRGFTLRFASAEALQRLVVSGGVSLYAMVDKQAWRLSLKGSEPVFAADTFPDWFHEMEPATVPAGYVRSLGQRVDRAAAASVVWGVQLPPATRQGIAALTRGRPGGNLLIGADGQVTLEPE